MCILRTTTTSLHGRFHRFLFPLSIKFPDLNFAPYALYIHSYCMKPVRDTNSVLLTINRPFAASHSRRTKPPCWRAKVWHWDETNKGNYHLKLCMSLVCWTTWQAFEREGKGSFGREGNARGALRRARPYSLAPKSPFPFLFKRLPRRLFFCLVPMRLLLSSVAVLYHVNG